jgi:hypothetical protein
VKRPTSSKLKISPQNQLLLPTQNNSLDLDTAALANVLVGRESDALRHHLRRYDNRRGVDGHAIPAAQNPFRHVYAPATYEVAVNSTALEGIELG